MYYIIEQFCIFWYAEFDFQDNKKKYHHYHCKGNTDYVFVFNRINFIILFSFNTNVCMLYIQQAVALRCYQQVIYVEWTLKERSARTAANKLLTKLCFAKIRVTLALLSTSHRFVLSQVYYRLQYNCVALIETCHLYVVAFKLNTCENPFVQYLLAL